MDLSKIKKLVKTFLQQIKKAVTYKRFSSDSNT